MHLYRLQNEHLQIEVTNLGVRLVSMIYLGSNLHQQLVLGQWSLAEYEKDRNYVGAVVGRTCNRIQGARFELDGEAFQLDANEGQHHLHGGESGFHNCCWQVTNESDGLLFKLESQDGESGYPGRVDAWVRISLIGASLQYEFGGRTDQPGLLDMTSHSYYCLDDTGSIEHHELTLASDRYAVINDEMIPTGELRSVAGSPFDFREKQALGKLRSTDPQLILANGFDHAFTLQDHASPAALLFSPESNIEMAVWTDLPALQLYTGNHLDKPYSAVCLESQHLPNACNQPGFKAPVIRPDDTYRTYTRFDFRLRTSC